MVILKGWGGYPQVDANLIKPNSLSVFIDRLKKEQIPRGMGRSYGDSASAREVIGTTYLDHLISFDTANGLLTCESGITIRKILKLIVPAGWFIGVTPGTSYVTLGGAIASDIHGKNHHTSGTFGDYVEDIKILLGTGEVVNTSKIKRPDLFLATCGGMGLTGIILSATIKLIPIKSTKIVQRTIKSRSLEETCDQFDKYHTSNYLVAWIDCLKKDKPLGRSILILGDHYCSDEKINFALRSPVNLPSFTPGFLLNRFSVSTFNSLYFSKTSHNQEKLVDIESYFYPLDYINYWNRLYGKSGFVQYQFVVPLEDGVRNLKTILTKIIESKVGSFLGVLKKFGPKNNNLLSFPMLGYTLAVDLKMENKTLELISELDSILVSRGGKIYLTKDALMPEAVFKKTYPQWEIFESIREKYGAIGHFASNQSKRLGLK